MTQKTNRLTSCLLITNPKGTSYRWSRHYESQLKETYGDHNFELYRLTSKDFDSPKKLRARLAQLDKQCLLAVLGGDGTANYVLNQLQKCASSSAVQATILPLWGGNACDLASMANGKRRTDIRPLLHQGERTEMHPMQYHLKLGKVEESAYAMCYVSFGAVAFAANALDESKLVTATTRIAPARFISEMIVSLIALQRAQRFTTTQTNKETTMYDLLLVNGPRMAKVYRTPADLTKPGFVEVRVLRKYPVLFTHLAHLTRSWVKGSTVKDRSFRLESDTWMQFDGEVRQLKAGTTVSVVPADQPLYLLATTA